MNNVVRLTLFVLAYNRGNFLRRLVLPPEMARWILTTLREKLVKIGARLTRHARRLIQPHYETNSPCGPPLRRGVCVLPADPRFPPTPDPGNRLSEIGR